MPFPASFYFNHFYRMRKTDNFKILLVPGFEPVSEATALSTSPQPRPWFQHNFEKPFLGEKLKQHLRFFSHFLWYKNMATKKCRERRKLHFFQKFFCCSAFNKIKAAAAVDVKKNLCYDEFCWEKPFEEQPRKLYRMVPPDSKLLHIAYWYLRSC